MAAISRAISTVIVAGPGRAGGRYVCGSTQSSSETERNNFLHERNISGRAACPKCHAQDEMSGSGLDVGAGAGTGARGARLSAAGAGAGAPSALQKTSSV